MAWLWCATHWPCWCACCLQTTHERGIVISAGGKYYLPQAVVLLRILRHNLNCTLPVDLFWLDSSEMDDVTFKVSRLSQQYVRPRDAVDPIAPKADPCSNCQNHGMAVFALK